MKVQSISWKCLAVFFLVMMVGLQFVITSSSYRIDPALVQFSCLIYIPWILFVTLVFGFVGTYISLGLSLLLSPIIYFRSHLPYPFLHALGYMALSGAIYFFINQNRKVYVQEGIRLNHLESEENNLSNAHSKLLNKTHAYQAKIIRYSKLRELGEKLVLTLSLSETAGKVLELMAGLIGKADKAYVFLLDDHFKAFILTDSLDITPQGKRVSLSSQDPFNHWLLKNHQNLLIEDIKTDIRFQRIAHQSNVCSLIETPLITENKLIGAIRMESYCSGTFALEDLRLLDALTSVTSTSLKNARLYSEALALSLRDGLTNLFVPTYFHGELQKAFIQAKENHQSLYVMMADIDNFKEVNDRFGHSVGDATLKNVSEIFTKIVDSKFIPTRYGGEEFSAFFPELTLKEVSKIVEDFRKQVEENILPVRRENVSITLSIGISNIHIEDQGKDDLIHRSDLALYQAKHDGKNRICFK